MLILRHMTLKELEKELRDIKKRVEVLERICGIKQPAPKVKKDRVIK